MPRVIIFDSPTIQRIAEVIDYAHRHPLNIDDMLDIINKQKDPPGDDPNHVVDLSFGCRVVYSEEYQTIGLCKHLSVSVDKQGKLPNPGVVSEIMAYFGIETSLADCYVDFENIGPMNQAVNIVELPPGYKGKHMKKGPE